MCMCMHVHVFARTSVVGLGRLFRGWRQDSVCLPWDGASSGRVEAGLVRGACRSSCEHRAHSPRSHREGCTWRYQRVNTSIHVTVKAFSALFHVKECGEILRRNSVFLLNVKECRGIGYFNKEDSNKEDSSGRTSHRSVTTYKTSARTRRCNAL